MQKASPFRAGLGKESAVGAKSVAAAALSNTADGPVLYRDLVAGISAQHVRKVISDGTLRRDDVRRVIPDRTLDRRVAKGENLTTTEADGIARLERVVLQARAAFGDPAVADEWLHTPNPSLDGNVPMEMAATDLGAREVETVLGRIACGVHS